MLRSAVADQPPECTRTKLILSLSLLKRLPGISKNSSWHYRSSTGSLYTILPEKFKQSEILAQWMPNMLCPTLLPMGILYEELSLFLGELFTGSEDFVIQSWEQSVTKQWLPGDGPAKAMMMSRAQPSATVWGEVEAQGDSSPEPDDTCFLRRLLQEAGRVPGSAAATHPSAL